MSSPDPLDTRPKLEGMHRDTASTTGWILDLTGTGAECLFCGGRAERYKPLNHDGPRLWWCQPCETTWVA